MEPTANSRHWARSRRHGPRAGGRAGAAASLEDRLEERPLEGERAGEGALERIADAEIVAVGAASRFLQRAIPPISPETSAGEGDNRAGRGACRAGGGVGGRGACPSRGGRLGGRLALPRRPAHRHDNSSPRRRRPFRLLAEDRGQIDRHALGDEQRQLRHSADRPSAPGVQADRARCGRSPRMAAIMRAHEPPGPISRNRRTPSR